MYELIFSSEIINLLGLSYYVQCKMESDWVRGQRGAACAQEAGRSLETAEPRSKELCVYVCAVCNTGAFLQLQGAVRTVLQGSPWVSFKSTEFF